MELSKKRVAAVIFALLACLLASPASAKVKLVWITCCSQADRHEMFQRWAERFEARNPDIEVEWIFPAGNYTDQITTRLVTGAPLDVFWAGAAFWSWYESAMPLDTLLEEAHIGEIFPAVRQWYSWQGELLGMPYGANSTVMYNNKRHLEEAGLPPPTSDWTWDDFLRYGRALTRDVSGSGAPERYGVSLSIHPSLLTYGAPFYTPDGTRTQFNNPATRAALEAIVQIISPAARIHAGGGNPQRTMQLINGTTSIIENGVFAVPQLRQEMVDDWDVVTYPYVHVGEQRYRSAFASGEGWVIPKTTQHPEEALRFVKFLMEPEQMSEFAALGGIIPTQPSVAASAFLTAPPPPQNLVAFVETLEFANAAHYYHPKATPVWNAIGAEFNKLMAGEVPVGPTLAQMAQLADSVLQQ